LRATIWSTHDDGSAETFRDEYGGVWRIFTDDCRTYAVERVTAEAEVTGCGVCRPMPDGSFEIYPYRHGCEDANGQPATYGVNCRDEFVATRDGWEPNGGSGA
jgi:hypothetical protein